MGKGGEWLEVVSRITFHEAELKLRVRDFTYCRTTNSAMLAPVLDRFKRKLQYNAEGSPPTTKFNQVYQKNQSLRHKKTAQVRIYLINPSCPYALRLGS